MAKSKLFRIEIRLTGEERVFIWDEAKKLNLSTSEFIRCHCIHESKTNKELYETIIRQAKLKLNVDTARTRSFQLFFDKNAMRRVMAAANFSQYNLSKINMDEIRYIIQTYQEIYDSFPEEIKQIKESAMKELNNCRNRNYLIQKLKIIQNQIDHLEQKKVIEIEGTSHKNMIEHIQNIEQEKRGYRNGEKIPER